MFARLVWTLFKFVFHFWLQKSTVFMSLSKVKHQHSYVDRYSSKVPPNKRQPH